MNILDSVLKNEEKAVFNLRELYGSYGYSRYKMSKFEEYDLYVRNKDFLVSDSIITFTDPSGKLMAMKPDVTLSIIKNGQDESGIVQKVYYNENVYRISKGNHSYKEIMQIGLECIGSIDNYNVYEVLMLAAKSLKTISDDCILDISHLGIISEVIKFIGLSENNTKNILKCISEKNLHGIIDICRSENIQETKTELLKQLITVHGKPSDVIPVLESILVDGTAKAYLSDLKLITSTLENDGLSDLIRIDFSVINDMNYYNGIVFKGFIKNIPTGVLSGGQYDKLMNKMKRKSGAIGFAVYLDLLERFDPQDKQYDVDTVILYGENDNLVNLNNAVKLLTDNGKSVMAQKSIPQKIKYKQLLRLNEKGVEIVEADA